MSNILVKKFDSEKKFWGEALEDVVFSIKETLSGGGENFSGDKKCRIGLAGGSTPKKLYEMLAGENLPWGKIKLIQVDERYVPSDDKNSNLGMIRGALLKKISLPPENLISFDTCLKPGKAALEMDRKISELKRMRTPVFDLLILGAGSDGHIASLFEGDEALRSAEFASLATAKNAEINKGISTRLTLTIPALESSRRVLLLLKGESKKYVLRALEGKAELPVMTAFRAISGEAFTKVLYC